MLLDKKPDGGLDLLEAALLAAQRKHLESKNAGGGFRLQALPKREGLFSKTLAVFEAAYIKARMARIIALRER
jgi:hypothetical protein